MRNLKETIKDYLEKKKAIAAFTINNLETIKSTIEVSKKLDAPVILMVSPSGIKYFGGIKNVYDIFTNTKKEIGADKVFLHLDHSLDKQVCIDAIDIGFDSVMFDGSMRNLEENIKMTKEVVDYAKAKGVLVEGEIGEVGGKEDDVESEVNLASVDAIKKFYNETNVDILAASVGTVHGDYKKEPEIRFDIVKELKDLNVPLVLHGSSGLAKDVISKLILLGEVKINVNTKNQNELIAGLRKEIETAKLKDIRDVSNLMMKYFKQSITEVIMEFENV